MYISYTKFVESGMGRKKNTLKHKNLYNLIKIVMYTNYVHLEVNIQYNVSQEFSGGLILSSESFIVCNFDARRANFVTLNIHKK